MIKNGIKKSFCHNHRQGFQREQQQKTMTAFFIISNGKIHQLNEDIPLYNQYGL